MGERIEPAAVGGEQRRHVEVVDDACKAGWSVERALGIEQGEKLAQAQPQQVRHAGDA
jgi:hypothetical protein